MVQYVVKTCRVINDDNDKHSRTRFAQPSMIECKDRKEAEEIADALQFIPERHATVCVKFLKFDGGSVVLPLSDLIDFIHDYKGLKVAD